MNVELIVMHALSASFRWSGQEVGVVPIYTTLNFIIGVSHILYSNMLRVWVASDTLNALTMCHSLFFSRSDGFGCFKPLPKV